MSAWRTLLHRLGYLPRQRRFDRQLEARCSFTSRPAPTNSNSKGMRAPTHEHARLPNSARARVMEDTRAAWQFRWLEDVIADVSYAVRAFRPPAGVCPDGHRLSGARHRCECADLQPRQRRVPAPASVSERRSHRDGAVHAAQSARPEAGHEFGRLLLHPRAQSRRSSGWACSGSPGSASPSATPTMRHASGCRVDGRRRD